ncbi:Ubiquitin fusion degradation protein 1 [Zancudomyces culisetae]|uniref:Ubiquitin fusion degradation protein 1 n=1 Tax=Zancudomyces culisetae TaxID=1213189 RepID=A0A1R1PU36_ZANCU|nr:Ubiquitin fusion degradation protein 1 [Zancudomyces culisetae]|eukprot:OMH84471.1 Ubiquitin fusion degradation protein 1 [Zancudomyces culisetae]
MYADYNQEEDQFGGFSGFPFGFGRRRDPNQTFKAQYRAFSLSSLDGQTHQNANYGGKIFLPSSALDRLSRLNVEYPMLFRLTNNTTGKISNAGVLEFTANEGQIYLPEWLMKTLGLQTRDFVSIENISLKLGSFVKIQPQSTDFLDISDHRAVLENALRNYSTLTTGDKFTIKYNNKLFDILVVETQPDKDGISIVETDLRVDFEAPPGYVEPSSAKNTASSTPAVSRAPLDTNNSFSMFNQILPFIKQVDMGNRRKPSLEPVKNESQNNNETAYFDPNNPAELDLPMGCLFFGFPSNPAAQQDIAEESGGNGNAEDLQVNNKDSAFSGGGRVLKPRKKRNTKNI